MEMRLLTLALSFFPPFPFSSRCVQLMDSLSVYRGGYSPLERRKIESELSQGQVRAVAATNALELGIDVGSIDVTIHLGYPGR